MFKNGFFCTLVHLVMYISFSFRFLSFNDLILVVLNFSLIERARRTVRGSADDIGWLQRAPEMPPVEDGTERFMEVIDDIRCNEPFCHLYRPATA